MIYLLDTNKIKARAYDKMVESKNGKSDVSIKDIIRATELMLDIVNEYGVIPASEELED